MKIVLLIDYFQPKIGYQEFFLAREFKKIGHQVFVITSNYYFLFPDYKNTVYKILGERKRKIGKFIEEGINVYRVPLLFEFGNGAITMLKNLERALREVKPDVVFADGVFTPLAFQVAYYKKKIGYKLFYDSHASTFNTKLYDRLSKRIYMWFFKKFLMSFIKKNADGFTAVGESEKWFLCKEYNLKENEVKLIPLGADTSVFYPDKRKREKTRKILGIKDDEVLIVYAGKITKNKDLDILFKALAKVKESYRKWRLLVISGGEREIIDELKEFTLKNNFFHKIIWREPVENKKLVNFYNAADIGIWPGDLSNTILEAIACGLPVILPKFISKSQRSDHLLEGKNGFSFERKNFSDLSDKIMILLKNKNIRELMGKRGEKLIKREYSWQKIAQKYLSLVNN